MRITPDVPLALLTTMKVGGPARFVAEVLDHADFHEALAFAQQWNLPFAYIGNGCNVLAQDQGFPGVLIKSSDNSIDWGDGAHEPIVVGAGVNWDSLVAAWVARGLPGMENLSGIPGSVGASPVQNIGAYGREVREFIQWVEAFDAESGKCVHLDASACKFGYRDSIFKRRPKLFIARVAFGLSQNFTPDIRYRDLSAWFEERGVSRPTGMEIRDAVLAIRAKKFPDLSSVGTAGSFFKNPIVSSALAEELQRRFPGIPVYPIAARKAKLSAAWLIDHVAGMRGERDGDVGCWKEQALVVVNYGRATAQDISMFADRIARVIQHEVGVALEREVVDVCPLTLV
jgi:UDP-N-acetylmuramate dehydrogenase